MPALPNSMTAAKNSLQTAPSRGALPSAIRQVSNATDLRCPQTRRHSGAGVTGDAETGKDVGSLHQSLSPVQA